VREKGSLRALRFAACPSRATAFVGALVLGLVPAALAAQSFGVTGRVVHVGDTDSTPVAGVWAVLHQVTMAGGGPVDSGRTDRAGRYRLRVAKRDSSAVYIVSVSYAGIAYFTRPLHALKGASAGTAELLAVYDTSSTSPPVQAAQRHIIVRRPEQDGSRHVLELLVLRNVGTRTRISPDTARPVWQGALPRGALQLEVGESDVSSEAVYRRGDSIAVAAPVPPGDKQVVVSYILPRSGRRFDMTLDQAVARFNVLVEDTAATLEGDALDRMGSQSIEGTNFVRFARNDVRPGAHVVVVFSRGAAGLTSWWWLVVGMAAAALFGSLVVAWRRTRPIPGSVIPADADTLAAQIAALDVAFEGRTDATPADRDTYQRRRAELKAHLEQLLLHR
jgi:hypothetical protein